MRTARCRPREGGGTMLPVGAGKPFLCPRPCATAIGCGARTRLAHWLAAASVRIEHGRRHGSLQEQVRREAPPRAGCGAVLVPVR